MDRRTFLLLATALGFAGRVKAQPASGERYHAARDSRITLLYLGQATCVPCRGYEAEYFGRMHRMATSFPEFGEVDYLKLSMGSGKATVSASQLPDHLKWIATEQRDGAAVLQNRGTPFFAGIVDTEVWAQGDGVAALEGSVIPALRRAVQQKRSA
ncbi:hypothetical protein [Cupriavidus numazuensis]|uniref:Thioredoxin-like fold domain-containing protein n=1 Tax=Cupriavidus numazuensis TaxID=221992 RepID=A0ABN7Q044_9BURK|nr:hypothetical protein [Cupriavidus numazuensis]CAG2150655.1 hypothetical protein LMG26411_03775 [Cupriavidus numazuensis]